MLNNSNNFVLLQALVQHYVLFCYVLFPTKTDRKYNLNLNPAVIIEQVQKVIRPDLMYVAVYDAVH